METISEIEKGFHENNETIFYSFDEKFLDKIIDKKGNIKNLKKELSVITLVDYIHLSKNDSIWDLTMIYGFNVLPPGIRKPKNHSETFYFLTAVDVYSLWVKVILANTEYFDCDPLFLNIKNVCETKNPLYKYKYQIKVINQT
tara:strand:- start:566 stop:994 length:429 start_codon:yes stop_codon:yes gene_type:complete